MVKDHPAKDVFFDPLYSPLNKTSFVFGHNSEENGDLIIESSHSPQPKLSHQNEKLMGGTSGTLSSTEGEAPDKFASGRNAPSSSTMRSNITIDSALLHMNRDSKLDQHENHKWDDSKVGGIASLFQSTGISSTDGTSEMSPAMHVHIQTLHHTYKRRFQNRPSDSESKHFNIHSEECNRKYFVTKLRSWRSGYSRILSLHTTYFTTVDPGSREITNLWYYHQVVNYMAVPNEPDCMLIEVIENSQSIKLKLKCQSGERDEALTDFVRLKYLSDTQVHLDFTHRGRYPLFDDCFRQKRNGSKVPVSLLCAPYGILELNLNSGSVMRTILYRYIHAISFLNGNENGIVLHMNETNSNVETLDLKVFYIPCAAGGSGRSAFVTSLKNRFELLSMKWNIAESLTLERVQLLKQPNDLDRAFGECMASHKLKRISVRRPEGSDRFILLTRKGFLLEMRQDIKKESSTLTMCSSHRSLQDVSSIVCHSSLFPPPLKISSNAENYFTIEYKSGVIRTYFSENRDSVIVGLLDVAIYICRNFNVTPTHFLSQSYRMRSSVHAPEEPSENNIKFFQSEATIDYLRLLHEVASVTNSYLKMLNTEDGNTSRRYVEECFSIVEVCNEFNTNVPIERTPFLSDDKNRIGETGYTLWILTILVLDALQRSDNDFLSRSLAAQACSILQTQYRLLLCPWGYIESLENPIPESIFIYLGKVQDHFVQYWFMKCLSVLILPLPFSTKREIENEVQHKKRILEPTFGVCQYLVRVMVDANIARTAQLLVMVCSNILESILCSHKDSTSSEQFDSILNMVSEEHQSLLRLLDSSNFAVLENTALFLQVLQIHSSSHSAQIRELALTSGTSLRHFYLALFGPDEGQRCVSQFVCSLWMSGSIFCDEKLLLKRMLPLGFLAYLDMPLLSSKEERELDKLDETQNSLTISMRYNDLSLSRSGVNAKRFRTKVLALKNNLVQRKEDTTTAQENFRIFFHMLTQDHYLPDLIWNRNTLMDLKSGLEQTLQEIDIEVAKGIENIAWNHQQYTIHYNSLNDEIQVGSIFLRVWLESGDTFVKTWPHPLRLFENLYRRIIFDIDKDVKVTNLCIKSIQRLYTVHMKAIGMFPDIPNILRYVSVTNFEDTRYCLLSLLRIIIGIDSPSNEHSAQISSNIEQLLNPQSFNMITSMIKDCYPISKTQESKWSASHFALRCFIQIVCVHKSVNSQNIPFFPIPLAKRMICSSHDTLSIICNVLLKDDDTLVDIAAELLRLLMAYNDEECKHLYKYGVFYFILRYRGRNWTQLSLLLHDTHMKQNIPDMEAHSISDKTSILEFCLPAGLLNLLTLKGPNRFAEVFISSCDTPEVIWNQDMREYLTAKIDEHIDEFLRDFQSDPSSTYSFKMIPRVSYDRLENEIFCHSYYLSNLRRDVNTSGYAIDSPMSLFLDCLKQWSQIFTLDINESTVLSPEGDVTILSFPHEKLHLTVLLMETQLIICKQYPACVEGFKYPAYQMLLRYLVLPSDNKKRSLLFSSDRVQSIRTATELVFYTCLVSPMNAKSIVSEGGVLLLSDLINFCIENLTESLYDYENRSDDIHLLMETLTYLVKTISGVAFFSTGRDAIEHLPDCSRFCRNWCSCIHFGFGKCSIYGLNLLRRFALEGLASLTKSEFLQSRLTECGVLYNLLRIILTYDDKFHISSIPDEVFQISISRSEANYHAALASRGLGMLCGVLSGELSTPFNSNLFDTVKHLLTSPIAKLLRNQQNESFLLTLNLYENSPLRLWDANMRSELNDLVATMEEKQKECPDFMDDLEEARKFNYSNMGDEINIGGVYIRLFNSIDDSQIARHIPDCISFTRSIIHFLGRSLLHDGIGHEIISKDYVFECDNADVIEVDHSFCSVNENGFEMTVIALGRLLKFDSVFDQILCDKGSPAVLVSCLALQSDTKAWSIMADILIQLSNNPAFASSISNDSGILKWFMSRLENSTTLNESERVERKSLSKLWIIMENLASTTSIASYMTKSSCWLEFLAFITKNSRFNCSLVSREGATRALARLLFDPNSSAIIGDLLRRFIPSAFVTELKENGPTSMLKLYDTNSDTAELIWDDSMRSEVNTSITFILDTVMDDHGNRISDQYPFHLPSEYKVHFSRLHDEYCLGGIYINNFLKDASFSIRDPVGFLEGLLLKFSQDMETLTRKHLYEIPDSNIPLRNKDIMHEVSLVVECIKELCCSRPFLCSKFSSWLYNKQLIYFLHSCAANHLVVPLRYTVALILVSSRSMDNIEDISVISDADGRNGIVDGMIKAINGNPLHRESDMMIRCLAEVFRMALGDLECFKQTKSSIEIFNSTLAIAPSPAPTGTHPVSKMKKISIGEDPLASMNDHSPTQGHRSFPVHKSSKVSRNVGFGRLDIQNENSLPDLVGKKQPKANHNESGGINISQTRYVASAVSDNFSAIQTRSMVTQGNSSNETNKIPSKQVVPKPECLKQSTESFILSSPLITNLGKYNTSEEYDAEKASLVQKIQSETSMTCVSECDEHHKFIGIPNHSTLNSINSVTDSQFRNSHIHSENLSDASMGAPGCAKGRPSLLDSAVKCRLPIFLVMDVLNNKDIDNAIDPNGIRKYTKDLLMLLLKDPGYGPTFELMLNECLSWKAVQKYISE